MIIYVIASNKYIHILEAYSIFFNKYWPNQTVKILCYDKLPNNLPDNFEVISLGNQDQYGKYWTNGLIPYFKDKCKEDYFVITVEDMFLCRSVNLDEVNKLEEYIREGFAEKAMLHSHLNDDRRRKKSTSDNIGNGLCIIKQDRDYRTTLHPAIWTKSYFLKYLKPNMTAWDFEIANMEESKKDGAILISIKRDYNSWDRGIYDGAHTFNCVNIYFKGELSIEEIHNTMNEEDIKCLMKYGLL